MTGLKKTINNNNNNISQKYCLYEIEYCVIMKSTDHHLSFMIIVIYLSFTSSQAISFDPK